MFCEGCGMQIQSGLNYCSRCGRRIAEDAKDAAMNSSMIAAYAGGVGFVSYIFVILVMSKTGIQGDLLLKVTFVYFAALFAICFMILRQGAATRRRMHLPENAAQADPDYLRPVPTAQLPEPSDGPASVTEHTTRTLDTVAMERK